MRTDLNTTTLATRTMQKNRNTHGERLETNDTRIQWGRQNHLSPADNERAQ